MTEILSALPAVLLYWWGAFSVLGAGLAVYDKLAAKRWPRRRIRERTLLLAGFFGGAEAMLAVMLLIRHKTQHKKFMIGLPAMIVFHVLLAGCLLFLEVFSR